MEEPVSVVFFDVLFSAVAILAVVMVVLHDHLKDTKRKLVEEQQANRALSAVVSYCLNAEIGDAPEYCI